jgi:hypothetical protein
LPIIATSHAHIEPFKARGNDYEVIRPTAVKPVIVHVVKGGFQHDPRRPRIIYIDLRSTVKTGTLGQQGLDLIECNTMMGPGLRS